MNSKAASGFAIADLGWGDSGKGALVQNLTLLHNSCLNVRYNGGSQCAHNVFSRTGIHHCFSQFGSGSFKSDVRTHLGPRVLINPYHLLLEAETLEKKGCGPMFDRLTIDPRAVLLTPWHAVLNQILEICRGNGRHGSCGQGIGVARSMELKGLAIRPNALRRSEAAVTMTTIRLLCISQAAAAMRAAGPRGTTMEAGELMAKLNDSESAAELLRFYRDWLSLIRTTERPELDDNPVIFEGAQGVLLDETYGTAPYHTWTNTTFNNALELCREWGLAPTKIGVMRTYMTRHGAGPFPTEDNSRYRWPDHNRRHEWQGEFRQGALDLVALQHAVQVSQPDCLAVTHMDQVGSEWSYCAGYEGGTPDMTDGEALFAKRPVLSSAPPEAVLPVIEHNLGVPVRYMSAGPGPEHFSERPRTAEAAA